VSQTFFADIRKFIILIFMAKVLGKDTEWPHRCQNTKALSSPLLLKDSKNESALF